MTQDSDRPLGLPQGDALRGNLLLSVAFAAYFWIVYFAGDFVAARAAWRWHVALPFEVDIPFIPWMAVIYLTVTPFFCLAPFVLRTPQRLLPLFVTMCAEVTVAGLVFCLFPVELSFPPHEVDGAAGLLYRLAVRVALTYNCVPSLHVALVLTCAMAYAAVGGKRWRILIWSWALAIVASTLLTHQHHLADLASGIVLAAVAVRTVPPLVRRWQEGQALRANSAPAGSAARR
jgi:membrane-associated phospholipid phosphatase